MEIIQSIQNRIYEIRGLRVMLDSDLADLYQTETRILNQAVKRNIDRFPDDFMFQLTETEWDLIRTLRSNLKSQIVISSSHGGNRTLPFAFTEQGVAMLSSVLRSKPAVQMNIAIMRAFVEIRRLLIDHSEVKFQLQYIKDRLGEHDAQLNTIFDALENLLDEKASERKWQERERIGFNADR